MPPRAFPLTLASEESLTLVLTREEEAVTQAQRRVPAEYVACDDPHGEPPSRDVPAAIE